MFVQIKKKRSYFVIALALIELKLDVYKYTIL